MDWFRFDIKAYRSSLFVQSLTPKQEVCYLRLLMALYDQDGEIEYTLENLKGIFQEKSGKEVNRVLEKILPAFEIDDGIISHRKVTEEVRNYSKIRDIRRESGRRGGVAKARNSSSKSQPPPLAKSYQMPSKSLANIEYKKEEEEPPYIPPLANATAGAEEQQDDFLPETHKAHDGWLEICGLQDIHVSGNEKLRNLKQLQPLVVEHGVEKTLQMLRGQKSRQLGHAINGINKRAAEEHAQGEDNGSSLLEGALKINEDMKKREAEKSAEGNLKWLMG